MERLRGAIIAILGLSCVGLGGAGMRWMISTKPHPMVRNNFSIIPRVAVIPARKGLEQPPIIGHGTVKPKRQVNIVPQVSGALLYANPDLAQGKVIPQGELLFEIDKTVYESRVRQAEAEIHGLEASLQRLDREMESLNERAINAEQMVAIDQRDFSTSRQLYEVDKVGTRRDLDLVEQKYLRSKDALVELTSKRSMVPVLKLETEAQLDAARARLNQAEHDLERTKILCPFKARVETVLAQRSQVVTAYFSIATLTDMEAFEISVGLDPRDLRWLDAAIRPETLESRGDANTPPVTVRWSLADQEFTWQGFVSRFERMDEITRTARMVVEIRDADMVATVSAGNNDARPPLSIGMYCRAELPAAPLTDALLVPRHAVYEDRWVYVFEPERDAPDGGVGRLGRREVAILRTLDDKVLVDYRDREGTEICELRPGERMIISPLTRPVLGMKIGLQDESRVTDATRSGQGVASEDCGRSPAETSAHR